MSKKKLGIGTVDINKKFKDKEEAMRYAKRLKQFINDLCKRKKWQVSAMIGISQLKNDVSIIDYEISGKRGRPKKKVIINNVKANNWYKGNYLVDWHLHIIVVSNPSYEFINMIKDYIDKNWKDVENENKGKIVYKKKCNVNLTEYFIKQCEEVKFCHHNYSNEEDLKYSLKQYYYEYLKKNSAIMRLIKENKNNAMSEDKYLKRLKKIESKFLDIKNYFLELSKESDKKIVEKYMKEVQLIKIAENYERIEKMNKVQKNFSISRKRSAENIGF